MKRPIALFLTFLIISFAFAQKELVAKDSLPKKQTGAVVFIVLDTTAFNQLNEFIQTLSIKTAGKYYNMLQNSSVTPLYGDMKKLTGFVLVPKYADKPKETKKP